MSTTFPRKGGQNPKKVPLCIFCLKSAIVQKDTLLVGEVDSENYLNIFLKYFARFMGNKLDKYLEACSNSSLVNLNGDREMLNCCVDCEPLIKSFCEVYHHWRCMELQLEFKMRTLFSIMKWANKVPTRIKQLNFFFEDNNIIGGGDKVTKQQRTEQEKLKSFKRLRYEIINKCRHRLSKCNPRVLLKRLVVESSDDDSGALTENYMKPVISSETLLSQKLNSSDKEEAGLGWLLSFATVFLLALSIPSPLSSVPDNVPTHLESEEEKDVEVDKVECGGGGGGDGGSELMSSSVGEEDHNSENYLENISHLADRRLDERTVKHDLGDTNDTVITNLNEIIESSSSSSESSDEESERKCEIKTESSDNFSSIQSHSGSIGIKLRNEADLENSSATVNPVSSSSSSSGKIGRNLRKYFCKFCNYFIKRYDHYLEHKRTRRHKTRKNMYLKMEKHPGFEKACPVGNNIIAEEKTGNDNEETGENSEVCGTKINKKLRINVLSTDTTKTTQRYNFRTHRKRSYHDMMTLDVNDDNNKSCEKDKNCGSDNEEDENQIFEEEEEEESSSSCPSDDNDDDLSIITTGASNDDDDDNDNLEKESQQLKETHLICNLDYCNHSKIKKRFFPLHEKLHAPGHFNCSVCHITKENLAQLAEHERLQHPPSIKTFNKNVFRCIRCKYNTIYQRAFYHHFAETHGDDEDTTKLRCNICQFPVGEDQQCHTDHFKAYHDVTDMKPENILNCLVDTCPAYFKTLLQRFGHMKTVHQTVIILPDLSDKLYYLKSKELKTKLGEYKCPHCQKMFTTLKSLERHRKKVHILSHKFVCEKKQCRYRFPTKKSLTDHSKLHGKFTCKFCPVVKDFAPDLSVHEVEHAIKRLPPPPSTKLKNMLVYYCARCSFRSVKESVYVRHHLKSHVDPSLVTDSYSCSICQATGQDRKFFVGHVKTHHNTEGLDPSEIFRCDQCTAYFIKSDQLTKHQLLIHNNASSKCPECGKIFKKLAHLRVHIVRRHPRYFPTLKFFCGVVNCQTNRFGTQQELDKHLERVHNNKVSVKCSECDKMFIGKCKLNQHIKRFHADPSHVCNECGKAFRLNASLRLHMRYHNPEAWEFQCATCGKKCVDAQKLEDHQNTHTKTKRFICQVCGEKYAHRHNWRNHMKMRHKEEYESSLVVDGVGEGGGGGGGGAAGGSIRKGNYLSRKGSKKGDLITAGTKL